MTTLLQQYLRLLRKVRPSLDPPCAYHTPYNIGTGNIVQRPIRVKLLRTSIDELVGLLRSLVGLVVRRLTRGSSLGYI